MEDYVATSDSPDELVTIANVEFGLKYEWWHIWDTETMEQYNER
jgi:hypothetical protein